MTTIDMSLKPKYPVTTILDTAASVVGADSNTSKVALTPFAIQVEAVPAATVVLVESRISVNGAWVTNATITGVTTVPTITTFPVRMNFVRVRRSSGTGAVKAFAQG